MSLKTFSIGLLHHLSNLTHSAKTLHSTKKNKFPFSRLDHILLIHTRRTGIVSARDQSPLLTQQEGFEQVKLSELPQPSLLIRGDASPDPAIPPSQNRKNSSSQLTEPPSPCSLTERALNAPKMLPGRQSGDEKSHKQCPRALHLSSDQVYARERNNNKARRGWRGVGREVQTQCWNTPHEIKNSLM